MERFQTRGFELFEWQHAAVSAWQAGDGGGPNRGTLEIFTGGGKTLIALACCEAAASLSSDLRVAVVVPTEALAHQWRAAIMQFTTTAAHDIGLLGAGGHDSLCSKRVLVAVLNSAARYLPADRPDDDLMLIVDECHRAGAPSFANVLATQARFRLGLSATPDRDEYDDNGEPLEYDEQLVGRALGEVVYRFRLRDARLMGWLPTFTVHHHGVHLLAAERAQYDRQSRQIDDLRDRLADLGADAGRARSLAGQAGDVGALAAGYVAATAKRKDLLYRASERGRVAECVVLDTLARRPAARMLLFHERVDEAAQLYDRFKDSSDVRAGLEHSRLPDRERRSTLGHFRDGSVNILVSVKSLVEGIDVPSADVGISVASSSSVRQRIQSLGRVLRRSFDGSDKDAEMHVIYVANTVDDLIYAKEDWGDLTGAASNLYWEWDLDTTQPSVVSGPPRTPAETEDQAWVRLGCRVPDELVPWLGAQPDREYSVDTTGTVRTAGGSLVENPQEAARFVAAVRGRPGGRFFITPLHRLVIVREARPEGRLMLAGRIVDPYSLRQAEDDGEVEVSALLPGDPYPGPLGKEHGEYRISQKRGGVLERKRPGGVKEFALTELRGSELVENARRVLDAWRSSGPAGIKFQVNAHWHAWHTADGRPVFLAQVDGGFAWPSDEQGE